MTAEELRLAREESANVAYQTFAKHISENVNGFFCFYEGKDAPYYHARIKQYVTTKINYPISCKGKAMVLKVFELISNHKEYDKYSKGFFIDKDFDPSLTALFDGAVYETPTYSIENLYVNTSTIEAIIKNEFDVPYTDNTYKESVECYKARLSELLETQVLFNSWYCCLREKKLRENLKSTGVNLADKFPKGYMKMNLKSVSINYNIDSIRKDFPQAIYVDDSEILQKQKDLKSQNLEHVLRGKYLIEFMHGFLNLLIEDSNTIKHVAKTKIKYHIELSQTIPMFSQYAATPKCLVDYLNKFN